MSRTLIVVIHVIAFLLCAAETLYLSSWHKVPVQVTTAELHRCDPAEVAICYRVRYTYEVDGVRYESRYLRPFLDTVNEEIFWRAFNARRSGTAIEGFVSPRFPRQSALERYPGQISKLLVWLLISFHVVYWPGRRLLRKFGAYLDELLAKKEGRFDGPGRRGRTLRLTVFVLGSLALMLSPLFEKVLLPWKQERVEVLSMTPTPGPEAFCMTVVMLPVDAQLPSANKRVIKVCNSNALFQLALPMQSREAVTLYVRNKDGKEIVRLGPRVTNDSFRWALWYALLLVVLI